MTCSLDIPTNSYMTQIHAQHVEAMNERWTSTHHIKLFFRFIYNVGRSRSRCSNWNTGHPALVDCHRAYNYTRLFVECIKVMWLLRNKRALSYPPLRRRGRGRGQRSRSKSNKVFAVCSAAAFLKPAWKSNLQLLLDIIYPPGNNIGKVSWACMEPMLLMPSLSFLLYPP